MDHRANNFDFVRFLAAFFVIYGHCQVLDGGPASQIAGIPIHVLGVLVFFALSGYLVTESLQRHRSVSAFLAKRALRIFPALAVVVTLSAYVLGPAMTTLSLQGYLQSGVPLHYMQGIWLYLSQYLPGVFEDNIYKIAVNGSLWSLPAEFLCYLIVAASGFFHRRHGAVVLALALAITVTLNLYLPYYKGPQIIWYSTDPFQWAAVAVCFFVSSFYCVFRVPLNGVIGLVALAGLFLSSKALPLTSYSVVMWIVLPYIVLVLGSRATPIIVDWGRYGDFSYGMYLYSFPITQTIIAVNHNKINAYLLIVCVTVISVGSAYLSWHLVEKWALKVKPRSDRSISLGSVRRRLAANTRGVNVLQ